MKHKFFLFFLLVLIFFFQGLLPYFNLSSDAREKVQGNFFSGEKGLIRIHVIPNSNSLKDQYIKLQVRDLIIEEGSRYFGSVNNFNIAWNLLHKKLFYLEERVNKYLESINTPYQARLVTGIFPFPEKKYGDLVLPAGKYYALRVLLGDGCGKNWWCVLYPPLCFAGSVQRTVNQPDSKGERMIYNLFDGQKVKIKFESRLFKFWDWIKKTLPF